MELVHVFVPLGVLPTLGKSFPRPPQFCHDDWLRLRGGLSGGVEKPMILKVPTAPVAVVKMLVHTYVFRLEEDPEPHASRRFAIGLGAFSAFAKIGECTLMRHLVDKNIPSGGASLYCMLASGIAEGLMSIITAAAYGL